MLEFTCAFCGSINELNLDETTIESYELIEDCYVCCKPNTISIKYETGQYIITNLDNSI